MTRVLRPVPASRGGLRALALLGGLAACLALPATAHASKAVVSPLVAANVKPQVSHNLASLMSSELDFLGKWDEVTQLQSMPPNMNSRCLNSPSCLHAIARANQSDAVIAGAVSGKGDLFDLYFVYYEGGKIVRKKSFSVKNEPSAVADAMGGFMKELVTGVNPAQKKKEDDLIAFSATAADLAAGSDFAFDSPSSGSASGSTGISHRIPTPVEAPKDLDPLGDLDFLSEESPKPSAAEEAARRKAEEEARRRAAEEAARRKAEEEARAQASNSDDFDEIEFNKPSTDEIQVEEIEFNSAAHAIVVEYAGSESDNADAVADNASIRSSVDEFDFDSSRSDRRSSDESDDLSSNRGFRRGRSSRVDERARRASRDSYGPSDELDGGSSRSRTHAQASTANEHLTMLTGRAGFARFQSLSFITYGVEAAFMPARGLALIVGLDAHSSQRNIPPGAEGGDSTSTTPTTQWNTILPINLGVQYKMTDGTVRPYIGSDVVLIPSYVKDVGGTASGLRVRAGTDFMVSGVFGFNINGSAGFWSGKHFQEVAKDMSNSGLVPQVSAGTVFVF